MPKQRSSRPRRRPPRETDVAAMLRACDGATPATPQRRRELLAEFCKLIARQHGQAPATGSDLPPRMRETLQRLLTGDSEKEIAAAMGVSRHTVHTYVRKLYTIYGVCSRPELLAKLLPR